MKAPIAVAPLAILAVSGSNKPTRCFRSKCLMRPHGDSHQWSCVKIR